MATPGVMSTTAQPPVVYQSLQNLAPRTLNKTLKVGSLAGTVNIGPMGNATYSIPIEVPPGLGGMLPNLTINYTGGGNGVVGHGWSLGGLSAVSRTGSSLYYNNYSSEFTDAVDFDAFDRFALDGARLQFYNNQGTNASNKIYHTYMQSYAEVMGMGTVANTVNSHTSFEVRTKDNRIVRYGLKSVSLNSRVEASAQNNNEVLSWLISQQEDANGNLITYKYDYDAGYNHTRLSRIEYGYNKHVLNSGKLMVVEFEYGLRTDIADGYIADDLYREPYLLTALVTKVGTAKVARYELTYSFDNGRSQLMAVNFKKYNQANAPVQLINETRFNYGSPSAIGQEVVTQENLQGKLYPIDFNGDGFTDFISERYTANYLGKCMLFNQNLNTYDHRYEIRAYINQKDGTFTDVSVKQSFSSQIQVRCCDQREKFLRIKTGDFDGDGKGDFMVQWAFNEMTYDDCGDIKKYSKTSAQFRCEFWTYKNNAFDNSILPSFNINPGNYDRWQNSTSLYYPEVFLADLNADGLTDVFYDYNTVSGWERNWTANFEWRFKLTGYTNGNLTQTDHDLDFYTQPDSIFIADFTGDGKVDLLTQDGSLKRVHSLENRNGTPEIFTLFDEIITDEIVGIGDFNADGKADLATLPWISNCIPVGGLQNKPKMQFHINTGKGFMQGAIPDAALTIISPSNEKYDHLFFVDANQDGYSDFVEITNSYILPWDECNCIPGPTNNYDCYVGGTIPITKKLHLYNPQTKSFSPHALPLSATPKGVDDYVFADANGNGAIELWDLTGSTERYIEFFANKADHQLTQVSDGMGRLTTLEYGLLTQTGSNAVYQPTANTFNYPYLPINAPMRVVKAVKTPNGIGGLNTTAYNYTGLLATQMQGVLGFEKVEAFNTATGIRSITESELFESEVTTTFPNPFTRKLFLPKMTVIKEDVLISEQSFEYVIESHTSFFGVEIGWRHIAHTTTAIDHLKGTSSQTKLYDGVWESGSSAALVDAHGNIQKSTTRWYNNIGQTGTPVHTEITEATYTRPTSQPYPIGQPYPYNNLPLKVTVTNTRQGQALIERITDYEYFDNGNLKKEIFDAGNPESYSIAYTYTHTQNTANDKGFLKTETQSAAGLLNRVTTYDYSNDYRFVTSTTNPLGHTATNSYDDKTGWLRFATDANGNETEFLYDDLGTLIKSKYPDDTEDDSGIDWTPANGPSGSLYYTWSQPHAGGYAVSYKDALGREVRSEADIYTGLTSCQVTVYNAKGQLFSTSEPFAKNQSPQHWVLYGYDNFGRQQTIMHPNHTTTFAYTSLESKAERLVNGTPRISKQTHDARGMLTQSEDMGGTLSYTYYSNGKTKNVATLSGTVSMEYNLHGQRTKLTDPDAGVVTSAFDPYGQLLATTDAEGNAYNFDYDNIGRMTNRTGPEGPTQWTYDPTNALGAVHQVEGPNGVTYTYTYDNLSRLASETQTFLGQDFGFAYSYNTDGRLATTTYPNGLEVEHIYDAFGNVEALDLNGAYSANRIWNLEEIDAKGRLTQETYGNNITTQYGYDVTDYGFLNTWQAGGLLNYSYDWEVETGNLLSRHDQNRSLDEYFTYDDLDRLLTATVSGQTAVTLNYTIDQNGNIGYKSDAGTYSYNTAKPHAIANLHNTVNPPPHNQYVNYTPFKKVADITEGDAQLYLHYGRDQQRQWAEYYTAGSLEKTRNYTNGLYEADRDADGNLIEQRSYIMANGKPIAAVVQDAGGNAQLHYLYTDYLGSLLLTTDENGNPLHEQNFDAWGNHRDPNTWQPLPAAPQPSLGDRGYTFHEHLPQFALINMNGRVYDPVLGRFLSPDPYVQAPTNTQNYNRYSYVLNNPLKYTDPSGDLIVLPAVVVGMIYGAIMGATAYTAGVVATGGQWNWGAFGLSVLGGGITGGLLGLVSPASVTVFLTGQGLANAAAGGVLGTFMPSFSIPIGEWSINLSPSIFMGNASGLGVNIGASYSNGKGFQLSFGYSFTAFGSFHGGNASTFEQRFSGSIGYSSKGFGISTGFTQFYHGSGSEWNQRIGRLSVYSGEFSFSYENDGWPFTKSKLADGGDRMRTAALHVGYKNFGIGFNLVTGNYLNERGKYTTQPNPAHPDLPGKEGGEYIRATADDFRLGAVYMNVGNARIGNNSEWNRHQIQNKFAHTVNYQPWFRYLENVPNTSYFQYQNNPFSLW